MYFSKLKSKTFPKVNQVLEKMVTKIIEDLFNSTKEIENFFENASIRDNFIKCLEFLEKEYFNGKDFTNTCKGEI